MASFKRPADQTGDEGAAKRVQLEYAPNMDPFEVIVGVSDLHPSEFLRASPGFKESRYATDLWYVFYERFADSALKEMHEKWYQARKPSTDELWAIRQAKKPQESSSRMPIMLRTIKTLDIIRGQLDPNTELYRTFVRMQLDYYMAAIIKKSKDDRWLEIPGLDENFEQLVQMLSGQGVAQIPRDLRTKFEGLRVVGSSVKDISEIIGMREAQNEMRKIMLLVSKHPHLMVSHGYGGRNMLLYGPPGTGKTTVALSLAKESQLPVFNISSGDIMDKYLGGSERNVRAMFEVANNVAPSVLVLDEVDAICGMRETTENTQRMSSELLGCMSRYNQVMVVGITNLPWRIDPAFLRRFDTQILISRPGAGARIALLRSLLARYPSKVNDKEIQDLAQKCEGLSGSHLERAMAAAANETVDSLLDAKWYRKAMCKGEEWYQPCQQGTRGAIEASRIKKDKVMPVDIDDAALRRAINKILRERGIQEEGEAKHRLWNQKPFVEK